MEKLIRKKLLVLSFLILSVLFIGTAGYMILQGISLLDSLYMTVITIATVGFKEVKELDQNGKIFTIILIFYGFGIFTYAMTSGAKIIIEGEIKEVFKIRSMEKSIDKLRDHYIICGYGRMGNIIGKELKANGIDFVVIEKNKENIRDEDILYLLGDATNDEVLKKAGIKRAKGLISVLPSDAENLYVVLSAKELNPDLFLVARSVSVETETKLRRAGADRVVSPYHIGGLRIAHTVLRPTVVDFLEFATGSEHLDIQIEECEVKKDSELAGKTIELCRIRENTGVIIVAIKRADGRMEFNPDPKTSIMDGDILIALGELKGLQLLEKMCKKSL